DAWNRAEKILQRQGLSVQVHEDEVLPGVHLHRNQAVFRAVEIADAFKFDHAFQRAVDSVGPAVIRAAKLLRAALRFGDYSGGMMPADVVEGAQLVVFAARHEARKS